MQDSHKIHKNEDLLYQRKSMFQKYLHLIVIRIIMMMMMMIIMIVNISKINK